MRFLNDIDGSKKVKQDIDYRFVTDLEKDDISKIKNKVDKTYVDARVKTPVPINALFTDTIVTKKSLGIDSVENLSSEQILNKITKERITNKLGYTPLDVALKGVAGGIAELNESGKIPSTQLPSYVDDVMEFPSLINFPAQGEKGKIYTAKDTNVIYRWSGTEYIEISASLALGQTEGTAYPGDLGKIAYDHSKEAHAPVNAQKNSLITKMEIENKLTGVIDTHSHVVSKSDVGLAKVDNTSDTQKPVSIATKEKIDEQVSLVLKSIEDINATLTLEQERIAKAQDSISTELVNKVKTNVPINAKFTDTTTLINGKTGIITKEDIIALGIKEQGIPGLKGDKGDTGATGAKGTTGDRGPQGIQGIQGPKGDKGNAFIYSDFTSIQLDGLKGAKGDTGPQGIKGDRGVIGPEGPQGLRGLTGAKGDTGDRGPQGFKGDIGQTGADSIVPGPKGDQGIQGIKGEKGDTGPRGIKGEDSIVPGPIGPQGIQGPKGSEANITKVNVEAALGHSLNKSVPSNAVFTDTIYTHPSKHPASIITETTSQRFVSDDEKNTWNEKEDIVGSQAKATKALNDAKDYVNTKVKTDVPLNAKFTDTVYVHPSGTNPHKTTKADVGLSNVDNTADMTKPVSTPQQTALSLKEDKSSFNQRLKTTDQVQFERIGVGTASPNESLDVNGNIRVREEGSMKFGGIGSSDAKTEIVFNEETKSLDFNFF